VAQARPYQRRFRRELGRTLLYLADEYYLAARTDPPGAAHYDGFPQFENGIGMTRSLVADWRRQRARRDAWTTSPGLRHVSLVCGTLIAPVLEGIVSELSALSGVDVTVHAVANRFFGPRVNVSGLLVGQDLAQQLADRDLGDVCILPRYALDYTGGRFLDETTPQQLQQALRVPIAFASTMREVLQILSEPLESAVTGATMSARTNGKAWVDYAEVPGKEV
jgi:NifB/MoaA-like Fe-S oxidoreductase